MAAAWLFVALFLGCVPTCCAATVVSGYIADGSTWLSAGSPYSITANALLATGASLTIGPGVAVAVSDGVTIQINGNLSTVGVREQVISFAFGSGATMVFTTTSAVTLRWCVLSGGGGVVVLGNAGFETRDSVFENSDASGLQLGTTDSPRSVGAQVVTSTFRDNMIDGLRVYSDRNPRPDIHSKTLTMDSCMFTNNGESGVRLSFSYGIARVSNCSFIANGMRGVSSDGDGAAFALSNCTIVENGDWGFISSYRENVMLERNTFRRNAAGAIWINVVYEWLPTGPDPEIPSPSICHNDIREHSASTILRVGSGYVETNNHSLLVCNNTIRGNIFSYTLFQFVGQSQFENSVGIDHIAFNDMEGNSGTDTAMASISVAKSSGRLVISNNLIVNSIASGVEVKYLDPVGSTIDASLNWWGSPNLNVVTSRVFDFFHDGTLGVVNIVPVLSAPPFVVTDSPSTVPTATPTSSPTVQPTGPSAAPTFFPSEQPSRVPTEQPSQVPTEQPSLEPIQQPDADGSSSSNILIIASVCGGVGALVLVCIVAIIWRRARIRKRATADGLRAAHIDLQRLDSIPSSLAPALPQDVPPSAPGESQRSLFGMG